MVDAILVSNFSCIAQPAGSLPCAPKGKAGPRKPKKSCKRKYSLTPRFKCILFFASPFCKIEFTQYYLAGFKILLGSAALREIAFLTVFLASFEPLRDAKNLASFALRDATKSHPRLLKNSLRLCASARDCIFNCIPCELCAFA